jgi:hypothetical protein
MRARDGLRYPRLVDDHLWQPLERLMQRSN